MDVADLEEDLLVDKDLALDDATKPKIRDAYFSAMRGGSHEKVQWSDDDTISDWIPADKLQRKQHVLPLDSAIKWRMPWQVLRRLANTDGNLEAKSQIGMTFQNLLLGSSLPTRDGPGQSRPQ